MDPECSTSSSSSPPSSSRRPFALPASLRHACARPSPRRQRILIPSMLDAGSESGSGNVFNRQRQDTAATQVNSATVSPDDAAAAAVAASGETDVERRSRERVEYWAASLFQNSPMIRFMTRHLRMVGCDPYHQVDMASDPSAIPRLAIQSCPDAMAGGFTPSEKGQAYSNAGIVICSNHILNKKHLEQTLAHEMIHWWDHCRFRVDWGDLRQHACSEIRAASLSGDCNYSMETTRSPRNIFSIVKHHQACVRRRAVLSIVNSQACGDREKAERVVDEVWNSCFKDTRPFDAIYPE